MAGIIILNPTEDAVVAKYDGATYLFHPKSRKEIFVTFAARHILARWGKYGLVDVTFDDKASKKFSTVALMEHARTLEGLNNLLMTLMELDNNYQIYDDECDTKASVERMRFRKQKEENLKRVKRVEDQIKQVSAIPVATIMKEGADALRKQAEELLEKAKSMESRKLNNGKDSINIEKRGTERVA